VLLPLAHGADDGDAPVVVPALAQPPAVPPSARSASASRQFDKSRSTKNLATPGAAVPTQVAKGKPTKGQPTIFKPTNGKPAQTKPAQDQSVTASHSGPHSAKLTSRSATPLADSSATPAPQDLTLEEAIRIAIVDNTRVKNAYLDRVVLKYDLYVAESKFSPKFLLTTGVGAQGGNRQDGQRTGNSAGAAAQLPPSGARISFLGTSQALFTLGNWGNARGWMVNFSQPLLKGAGIDVNTASVRSAQFNEQANILRLKQTLMSTLISTISAFRGLVQSNEALAISQQSLERSRQTPAINRERIDAGRMAAVDRYQTEADVASREVSLLQAQNSLDAARLNLIKLLDLDPASQPRPITETAIPPVPQDHGNLGLLLNIPLHDPGIARQYDRVITMQDGLLVPGSAPPSSARPSPAWPPWSQTRPCSSPCRRRRGCKRNPRSAASWRGWTRFRPCGRIERRGATPWPA